MKLERQEEFVQEFSYTALPTEHSEETAINVSLNPFEITEEMEIDPDKNSILGVRIEFKIVLEKALISGEVAQFVQLIDRKVDKIEDLSREEVEELAHPLFLIIERMTYEVTEIALDQPGIELNFAQE
ncbi:DUF1149 family protein [Vagococcus vulneris]|uniref:Uncharacterized protein n=1 Tax=Vagococcus vulneris TaxID=1977869 RepID=A0A429ZXV5_9ENTE|nr:DUF1149 family protein [Vagococcus vulneris]RST98733.1 hypothetical protein CBF37_06700 [Vagococcus vulneris]